MSSQKTFLRKKADAKRNWLVVDADGQILGRLAVRIANILRGKNKPEFTPNTDCGDFVVVINAEKIKTSGNKEDQKLYKRHSGYPGGYREEKLKDLRARRPEEILRRAVKGMLPHNRLSEELIKKLKIYAGAEHPHKAQNPQELVG